MLSDKVNTESDEEIIKQIRAGNLDKYELIMRRYNQRLFRIARSILRNDEEAKDVIQDTYINCYTRLHQFKGPMGFGAWLAIIATNQSLMRLRQMKKVVPFSEVSSSSEDEASTVKHSPDPERLLENRQLGKLIEDYLETVPESFRLVFILRAVEHLSTRETAQILDIKEETVKTRYHRAKLVLQKRLSEYVDKADIKIYEFAGQRCDLVVNNVMSRLRSNEIADTEY